MLYCDEIHFEGYFYMPLSRTDQPFCYACISILKFSVSILGGMMCFTIDS